jgi:hypothetical protein
MPKSIADTVTTYNNVYPFQLSQVGATGNALILPFDTDRVIKAYYDRVYSFPQVNVTQGGKEVHKLVRLNLRRKESREITFDSLTQNAYFYSMRTHTY